MPVMKSLKSVIAYSRGGKITILDAKKLEEVAALHNGSNSYLDSATPKIL
jgi:hypothetical protein